MFEILMWHIEDLWTEDKITEYEYENMTGCLQDIQEYCENLERQLKEKQI